MKRLRVLGWSFYDFANSSYPTVIVTVAYSIYFKNVVAAGGSAGDGDFYWGLAISISMLIVACMAPFLGSIADVSGSKKVFLLMFASICVIFTGLLYFVERGEILLGIIFFVLANIGFEASLIFYNGFLPEISDAENFGKVSGYGWAFGYVGGLLCLIWVNPLIQGGFGEENILRFRSSFPRVAIFYTVFTIPTILWLQENTSRTKNLSWTKIVYRGWQQLSETFHQTRNHKPLARFLMAFFLYNDGIATVIAFSAIYAVGTLGFSVTNVVTLFVLVQVSACLGAFSFGFLVDRWGAKPTLLSLLGLWCLVVLAAYFTSTQGQYFVVAVIAGIGLGAVQSASRSLMALFIPKGKNAEFFGFYGICGKFSAILGPITFGTISAITGSQRFAILSVLIFFLLGMILLWTVKLDQIGEPSTLN